ncbi:hypothetical protein [Deinococcus sp. 6GRE01]|uniref:hypothetical protein n=1 Tax=Deinococcus sp. 6GRE01 TaxID=2745873 RepID=UPI001E518B84|nr:hypothetical protein [Deinococcus sp. 6GRE01]MCD0156002.1 hypothetical protein [Deinococcus sp. 6GRE01]
MPKTVKASPAFTDNLTVPRDGEAIDAGDVNAPMTALLGNDLHLFGLVSDLTRQIEEMKAAQGGFTLIVPAALTLEPARTYTYPNAINIGRQAGYSGPIDLSVVDLPAGVTATYTDPVVGNSADLTLTVADTVVAGIYNITFQGVGPDGKTARALLPITIKAQTQPAAFAISTSGGAGHIERANDETTQSWNFNVDRSGQFSDPITFALVNPPAGITAAWTANPVTGSAAVQPNATQLTVTAAPGVPAGTYNLSVRATGGGVVRTQGLALTITAAPIPTNPDYTLEVVYDAGDYRVTNGATVYINRSGGYTGEVILTWSGMGISVEPTVLINGQPNSAIIKGNTARVTANGTANGWANSGIAPLPDDYVLHGTLGQLIGHGVDFEGRNLFRHAGLRLRWGNGIY